ncbi:MAG: GNAT family N-acetyltransferase [Acidobacteriaceae bacterium]|nr:GNAT family N-acetyltransferase [Acidobacteriaceae bacterium]
MRKFAGRGGACFREYRSPAEMKEFYESAIIVSRLSFQKRIGHGLPEDRESVAALIRMAEQDCIRGYVLFHEDQPAAFTLCYVNGDWLTGELCGYDPSLSQFSPGNALIGSILERLFEEQRFKMLDLGTGDADYKAFFATGSAPCADMYYFRRTPRNVALVLAHWATTMLWQCTTRILDALQIKYKLKKLARNGWKRSERVDFPEAPELLK